MTYISKLISQKFGGLETKILELKPGLNVIYGPNEAGKSTWASMIKLLFYGWGTKKQEKLEYDKYCRDNGLSISTELEDYKGRRLHIERVKKDSCKAYFAEDGKICPELTGATPGEILFGVDRETFEKTVYIGQLGIPSGKSELIESKVSAIVSTGDAEGAVSYKEAFSNLDELTKEIGGLRRNSKIVVLQDEIRQLKDMLDQNRQNLINMNEKKAQLLVLEADLREKEMLIKDVKAFQAKERLEKVLQLEDLAKQYNLKVSTIQGLITKKNILPDEEFISGVEVRLRQCENGSMNVEAQKLELMTLQDELKESELGLSKFSFFEKPDYEANDIEIKIIVEKIDQLRNEKAKIDKINLELNELKTQYEVLKNKITNSNNTNNNVVGKILWGASATILIVMLFFLYIQLLIPILFAFPILILCIIGAIIKGKEPIINSDLEEEKIRLEGQMSYVKMQISAFDDQEYDSYCSKLKEFMNAADCADLNSYTKKQQLYITFKNEITQKKERISKERIRLEQRVNDYENNMNIFNQFAGGYFAEGIPITLIKGELESVRGQVSEIRALIQQEENAKARISALLADTDIDSLKILSKGAPDRIEASIANIVESEILQIRRHVISLGIEIAKLEALVNTKGLGLDAIESEIDAKLELVDEFKFKEKASKKAMDILAEAYESYSGRYAPELALGTGEMFNYLSNDRYNHISMNSDFQLIATNTNQCRFEQDKLSTGTSEQLWLALRLTLSGLIFRNSEVQPPIVLDDTFVNFDDERCQRGLDLLVKMSKERQVILFTCHSREVEYLKGNSDVHIKEYDKKWAI